MKHLNNPVNFPRYRSAMAKEADLWGDSKNFDYASAPKRGSQRGKRDFSDNVTYNKWHVFDKKDDYDISS